MWMNTLDLWCPWSMRRYVSKLFGGGLNYEHLLFLQVNGDDSHTSYGQPFNWKLTFLSLLTKAWATFFTVGLFYSSCLLAPLKWDWSHFAALHFDIYAHQLTTGTCNTLKVCVCWKVSALYGFNFIYTLYCQWYIVAS